MPPNYTHPPDILLVEDDPHDAELALAAMGEPLARRVAVVRDGAAALDYLYRRGPFQSREGGHPLVVLLDNKMPKVSGLEVLQTLKSDEQFKMIPIVALTSSRRREDLLDFYQHGVNAYVVKPLASVEFRAAIQQLIGFWLTVNEPPPTPESAAVSLQSLEAPGPATPPITDEIPAPYPAPGR